jgi:hypothetical protein
VARNARSIDDLRRAISLAIQRVEQLRADSDHLIEVTRALCEDCDRRPGRAAPVGTRAIGQTGAASAG